MDDILQINHVRDFDAIYANENLHPLVSVLDYTGRYPNEFVSKMNFGFYAIYLKDTKCGDIRYGRNVYDYRDKTLVFIAPGQVLNVQLEDGMQPSGQVLVFHPDLICGTPLGKKIDSYSFFSYQSTEALHLSEKERNIVLDCFDKIKYELDLRTDKHSKHLIAANIELFLDYCVRFYDRQFITRSEVNSDILAQFEIYLNDYFQSEKTLTIGLPGVNYFAEKLHLSTNYFGDLIKKETGKTAHEYIQLKLVNRAKEQLSNPLKSISEVAYDLGFKYPQHFTRAFKKVTGHTPNDFRILN